MVKMTNGGITIFVNGQMVDWYKLAGFVVEETAKSEAKPKEAKK
ncbi:MAG: hypothetical protein VB108_01170 [Anaerolineaceae bacterium]|nr:hypothetical protein [Anaerolineaceae bacterium]